jgi:hypothetical protein
MRPNLADAHAYVCRKRVERMKLPLAVAYTAVLALISPSITNAIMSPPLDRAQCKDRVVIDYEQPISEMQPIPKVPKSGRLPFGPPGLLLEVDGGPVLIGPSTIGFTLFRKSRLSKSSPKQELTAKIKLSMVRRDGKPIRVLRARRQQLAPILKGSEKRLSFGFRISRRSAFYRVDGYFLDDSGARVGHYAAYFRVVPSRSRVRLASSSSPLRGGEVLWRIENLGTIHVSFGKEFEIERNEGGHWIHDGLTPQGFPGVGFVMGAGAASQCESLLLSADMPSGRYRIRKPVQIGAAKRRDLFAEFLIARFASTDFR